MMRRIVLPGFGTATTFNPTEDSVIGVLTSGGIVSVKLKAGQPTSVEFVNSMDLVA